MAITPDTVAQLNDLARDFYLAAMPGSEAERYIAGRGLKPESIEHWQLGYAPKGPTALLDHLREMGWPEGTIVEAGLAYAGERGAIDAFRHRLVFPIISADGGRILAFSTRQLADDGSPKYLNSSDTPLFAKRQTFYGWPNADDIRRAGEAFVVEGNVDMLALWDAGVRNVVAVCGTALTDEHLAILAELCSKVTLVLDADAAGQKATRRSLLLDGIERIDLGVLSVSGGKDPADLLSTPDGLAAWQALQAERRSRWEYLWQSTLAPYAAELEVGDDEPFGADRRTEAAVRWKDDWAALVAKHATAADAPRLLERMERRLGLPAGMLAAEFIKPVSSETPRDHDDLFLVGLALRWDERRCAAADLELSSRAAQQLRDAWVAAKSPTLTPKLKAIAAEHADEAEALWRSALRKDLGRRLQQRLIELNKALATAPAEKRGAYFGRLKHIRALLNSVRMSAR